MATIVLVHGAWHGGWCWRRMLPLLRAAGHEVYAPTLTGLGERAHLASSAIDLITHVRDITAVLRYEELSHVTLVGHSYGGMVISGVASVAPERLAQVIYLDAFVPEPGQSLWDLLPPARREAFEEAARTQGDGWRLPPPAVERWGPITPDDAAWVTGKLVPQPIETMRRPFDAPRAATQSGPDLARAYIRCANFPGAFDRFLEAAAASGEWRTRTLAAGHEAMITHPRELARLLSDLAEHPGGLSA